MSAKKILVIEDDQLFRNYIALRLRYEGYAVELADDGQEGFNKAVTEDFRLIITDIKMPNWSGSESIYGLNLIDNKAKVIVMTGYAEDELLVELKEYPNIVGIFSKPFDTDEFLTKVKSVMIA